MSYVRRLDHVMRPKYTLLPLAFSQQNTEGVLQSAVHVRYAIFHISLSFVYIYCTYKSTVT